LGLVDIAARRPRVDDLARVEQVDVALGLARLRARGEHDRAAAAAQGGEEFAGAGQRAHLVDQLGVAARLALADRVAEPLLDVVAGDRRDELVAAHAVVAVDPPKRHVDPVVGERPAPGDRVVVVRVDQRSVDVDDRAEGDARLLLGGLGVERLARDGRRLPGRRLRCHAPSPAERTVRSHARITTRATSPSSSPRLRKSGTVKATCASSGPAISTERASPPAPPIELYDQPGAPGTSTRPWASYGVSSCIPGSYPGAASGETRGAPGPPKPDANSACLRRPLAGIAFEMAPGTRRRRDETILGFSGLVRSIARRYAGRGFPLDDLVQVGYLGLIQAVDRFDPSRGTSLRAYAARTIDGEIMHMFRDQKWAVRVPRGLQEASSRVALLREELTQQLGREPTVPEIADAAGLSVDEAIAVRTAFTTRTMPEQAHSVDSEPDAAAEDEFASEEAGFETVLDRGQLAAAMRCLPAR